MKKIIKKKNIHVFFHYPKITKKRDKLHFLIQN